MEKAEITYVLLLRGVNVGGKNRVPMGQLTGLLREEGFSDVRSCLASGNLLLNSAESTDTVKAVLRALIDRQYGEDIPLLLCRGRDYLREAARRPVWWREPMARRDVLFLMDDADPADVRRRIEGMPLVNEIVSFGEKVVFWGKYTEKDYARTAYHRLLLKEPFYPRITIRSGSTFDRIAGMLEG